MRVRRGDNKSTDLAQFSTTNVNRFGRPLLAQNLTHESDKFRTVLSSFIVKITGIFEPRLNFRFVKRT